jgi:hypothetical protein
MRDRTVRLHSGKALRENEKPTTATRTLTRGIDIVYYLVLPDGNVKIGTTNRPLDRLSEHRRRTGADDVLAIEFGGRDLERQRHREFAAERTGLAEHFAPSDALMAHIASLRQALNLTA